MTKLHSDWMYILSYGTLLFIAKQLFEEMQGWLIEVLNN